MGRIKTTQVKRIALRLVDEQRELFKEEFEDNKQLVGQFVDIPSKKLRNVIAGYVTRLIRSGNSSVKKR